MITHDLLKYNNDCRLLVLFVYIYFLMFLSLDLLWLFSGDFCMVNYADGKTEMGVCTELKSVSENCKNILPEIHPKQCPPMYSKCCPRDFEKLGAYLI